MRAFIKHLGLFLSPLILLPMIELFVLPIDFFTFRPWEALTVAVLPWSYIGPFYPNISMSKESIGSYDHSNEVPNPRRKHEEWITDNNGYRDRPRPFPKSGYDVVLTGDSNIVGAFNDQKDGLGEVLERVCACAVYNMGGARSPGDISEPGFIAKPPRFLVRNINLNADPEALINAKSFDFTEFKLRSPTMWPQWTLVLYDRFMKQSARQYFRARLQMTEITRWVDYFGGIRISQQARANSDVGSIKIMLMGTESGAPREEGDSITLTGALGRAERVALDTAKALRQKGTQIIYIFVPMDNHDMYAPLIDDLRRRSVLIVDFPPKSGLPKGFPASYWHTEDSHWTEEAIRDVANKIVEQIDSVRPKTQ